MEATIKIEDKKTFQSLIDFLKSVKINVISSEEPIQKDKPEKNSPNIEAINTICGKYRERLSSSRDFARRKQAEIKLEEKKWMKK